jgi:cell division protein FtsX
MWTVAGEYPMLLSIALAIGVAAAWWARRRHKD